MYKIEKRYINDHGIKVKFVVIQMHDIEDEKRPCSDLESFDSYLDAESYIMRLLTK